jgi:hypothetical protein
MLARLLGGINEALLFQQLAYWSDKGADPEWIYKTQKDIEDEITLTRTQQENARARLRKLGVIEEDKRGLPAKLYFRVVWDRVFQILDEQVRGKPTIKDAGNPQPRMRPIGSQGRGEPAGQLALDPPTITETTNRDDFRDDYSNHSNSSPIVMSKSDAERLAWYAQDLARELHDRAPAKSSATRLCHLYARSGLTLDDFLDLLQAARVRTKRYTASIKAEPVSTNGGPPVKPKMAYFFGVLEQLVGQADGVPTAGGGE